MTDKMTIVQQIYHDKINITDSELAEEIVKHKELECLDFWLLPQFVFDKWRRIYDYPRLISNIKQTQKDFTIWMLEQKLTDDDLLNCYLSDFFENKPVSKDKKRYLVKVIYEGEVYIQSWHEYNENAIKNNSTDNITYEFLKVYISYYDWKLLRGEKFSFMDTMDKYYPNTESEQVYLNGNIRLLKMGGIRPPTNTLGILLRGKKLDFVNVSGLVLCGTIHTGDMGNLSFEHCTIDNLKCNELDLPILHFQNCSLRNVQIRNSNIQQWLFANCFTTGNIIDSKLSAIRIFGGLFNPSFTNSAINEIDVNHSYLPSDPNFENTYRSLSKCAKECGNRQLAKQLKIKENDYILAKTRYPKKLIMKLDKCWWVYGQRPERLILTALFTILVFGLFYSCFPDNFQNGNLAEMPLWQLFYNTQYYSIVTFTTLGYGDILPLGFLKIFAAAEALLGVIIMGFLLAGLARKE
jgi:hypothetical protein